MSKRINREPNVIQLRFELGLRIGALIVGLYHMLMSLYRCYGGFSGSIFEHMDFVLFGALVLATASYLVFTKMEYPDTMYRVRDFMHRLFCPEMLVLMALFCWYVISCIACGSYYHGTWLKGNAFPLLDTAINVFIFFPLAAYMPENRRRQAIHGVIHIIVSLMTVLMVFVLWNVYHLNIIRLPGGEIGMTADVRLTVCVHPNTVAAYVSLFMMLCLYMILIQPMPAKLLYGFALFIHLVVLILTNSRTCFIAITASFMLCSAVYTWHRSKSSSSLKCAVLCVLASSLVFAFFLLARKLVFQSFQSITHFSELVALQNGASSAQAASSSANSASHITLKAESMSSRYITWLYSLKAMVYDLHKAVFGVTPISVDSVLDLIAGGDHADVYTHNQFLEVGVCLGFPGLILFIVYIVLIARNCLNVGLSKEQMPYPGYYVMPATIFMLVISNLTEGRLMFYHYQPAAFFFILGGWITLESRNLPNLFQRKPSPACTKAGKKKTP